MGLLRLVPISCGEHAGLLGPLAERLGRTFRLRVETSRPDFDPEIAFDASRGQYNSRILLAQLFRHAPRDATKVLGVTDVDLFVPVLTYVFGEAQLGSRGAVVSTYRLDSAIYGLPAEPELLLERLVKESVHEIGHTYDLVHCHRNGCVMGSSTYVEGIDLKSDRFCARCLRTVRRRSTGNGRVLDARRSAR